jgi:hypothetical protein
MAGSPCPWRFIPGIATPRGPSTLENSQEIDTICKHDEVNDVLKPLQSRGTQVVPDFARQLRHLFDADKSFPNTGKNLISEADTNGSS